jgi:hypothetical protein
MSTKNGKSRRKSITLLLLFFMALMAAMMNINKVILPQQASFSPDAITPKGRKVIIAKTIALNDVNDTIADMRAMSEHSCSYSSHAYPHHAPNSCFHLEWKLFVYSNSTHDTLLNQFNHEKLKQAFNAEVYLWENKNKVNFWFKYLNPTLISGDVDYIWMMDGDIQIRTMNWGCFWSDVETFQPAIFAPAVMSSADPISEARKFYVGSTHPQHCYSYNNTNNNNNHTTVPNDFQRLIAMDVSVVETQLPIFTRAAWQVVYDTFSEKVHRWGHLQSMWGPDLFWCKLVDYQLLQVNVDVTNRVLGRLEGRLQTDWNQSKTTCSIDQQVKYYVNHRNNHYEHPDSNDPLTNQGLPHACMIFHRTPVHHLDTKTIGMYKSKGREKYKYWHTGYKDAQRYKKGLLQFWNNVTEARVHLHRAYLSKTGRQCQACKHEACISG